jgi:hypothetical protein
LPLLLAGCSYAYEIRAVAIGGRLAFVPADGDYGCAVSIDVGVEAGGRAPRAVPAPGDDRLLVVNGGVHWSTRDRRGDCSMDFPIRYGADGRAATAQVAAKILRVDVPYSVNTWGEGAYGSGCFRITAERRIENLPSGFCFEPASGEPGEAG